LPTSAVFESAVDPKTLSRRAKSIAPFRADSHLNSVKAITVERKRFVQSYICSVTFPETIEGVTDMLRQNESIESRATDIDLLLKSGRIPRLFWTAPKWIAAGDVVFFYHTHRARLRSARLLAETRRNHPRKKGLVEILERSRNFADLYGGKIFACASIAGPVEKLPGNKKHFASPHFAPIRDVFLFGAPLAQSEFNDCVKIGRSTVTPLYDRELTGLKKLLSAGNELPDYLREAASARAGFANLNAKNWASISCSRDARFLHEAQLRAYWLDYFLKELKDKGSSVLEECECFRGPKNTGRSDYFVKIHGRWFPVEAKLKVSDDGAVLRQVAKYTGVDKFVPTKGKLRDKAFKIEATRLCLLFDRAGVYFVSSENEFVQCRHDAPFRKREETTSQTVNEVRRFIADFIRRCDSERGLQ
jgi:hypothetical protein